MVYILVYVSLSQLFINEVYAYDGGAPPFELEYTLPKDWKRQVIGDLRDMSVRKYTNKYESLFMWNSQLEITYYYDRYVDNLPKFVKDLMFDLKDMCEGMFYSFNPGAGLNGEGVYWEYSCPVNRKYKKGEVGLTAYIQGEYGLYLVKWFWRGPAYRPEYLPLDLTDIPIPVSELEMDRWYTFFSTVKLKKIKRRRRWE